MPSVSRMVKGYFTRFSIFLSFLWDKDSVGLSEFHFPRFECYMVELQGIISDCVQKVKAWLVFTLIWSAGNDEKYYELLLLSPFVCPACSEFTYEFVATNSTTTVSLRHLRPLWILCKDISAYIFYIVQPQKNVEGLWICEQRYVKM